MIRSMEIQSEKERQRVKEQNKVVKKMALEKRQMNKQLEHLEELRKRGFMDKSLAEQKAQAERMKADLQVFKARLVERDTEKAVLQKKKTASMENSSKRRESGWNRRTRSSTNWPTKSTTRV